MPNYFHSDRTHRIGLSGGQIQLSPIQLGGGRDEAILTALYPNGLSQHGRQNLLQPTPQHLQSSLLVEKTLEEVRRSSFPTIPSRFESFFACKTEADARNFIHRTKWGQAFTIWEVSTAGPGLELDMGWTFLINQGAIDYYFAEQYWLGHHTPTPLIEVLLPLPVTTVRRIP